MLNGKLSPLTKFIAKFLKVIKSGLLFPIMAVKLVIRLMIRCYDPLCLSKQTPDTSLHVVTAKIDVTK